MVETLFPPIGTLADQTSSIGASNNDTHAPVNTNDDDEPQSDRPIQEIESLCMQCREQGMTRLLLTAIPYFREVVLMSFHCQHCGASNNEIQSAGGVQGKYLPAHLRSKPTNMLRMTRTRPGSYIYCSRSLACRPRPPARSFAYMYCPHSRVRTDASSDKQHIKWGTSDDCGRAIA
jgi:hypothetical protein